LDLQLKGPNPHRGLAASAKARLALAGHHLMNDFPAVRYREAGWFAVLTLLMVIFFESSTLSGLGGRFLGWG
jgi:hypothetical protein